MNESIQIIRSLAIALVLMLSGGASMAFANPVSPLQSSPRVTAQLTTGVVKLGSEVACGVQVDGANTASLEEVPKVDGLILVRTSGPSIQDTFSSFSRMSRKRTHNWMLTFRPEAEGKYKIPPMRLIVDGKEVFTRELTLDVIKDLTGEELGHLEFSGVPEYVYEGQPFTVRMKFGWDLQFDAQVNFANLILPWWSELPGTLEVESGVGGVSNQGTIEIQVNSRIRVRAREVAQEKIGSQDFRMLEISRSFVATRSGRLDFPMSWLEFGTVRRRAFSEDRKSYHVGSPAFSLDVRVLPERGRPPEFSGGVGSFAVKAEANRRDVDLGESIKLTVDWTGDANLEFFELPNPARLAEFVDFRVYGTTNERFYGDRRRVVYDLAPKRADVNEIPPLPLVVFDPLTKSYRSVSTTPIPIRVRAIEGLTELTLEGNDEGPGLVARDIQSQEEVGSEVQGVRGPLIFGSALSMLIVWLVVRKGVRRRGDPASPIARRRRLARKQLRQGLRRAKGAGEQARVFQEFLGARSAERPAAWEGRDLEVWLLESDVELPEPLVVEMRKIAHDLDTRRWAGDDEVLDSGRILRAADVLMKEGL
jgi:hypothetical protein